MQRVLAERQCHFGVTTSSFPVCYLPGSGARGAVFRRTQRRKINPKAPHAHCRWVPMTAGPLVGISRASQISEHSVPPIHTPVTLHRHQLCSQFSSAGLFSWIGITGQTLNAHVSFPSCRGHALSADCKLCARKLLGAGGKT